MVESRITSLREMLILNYYTEIKDIVLSEKEVAKKLKIERDEVYELIDELMSQKFMKRKWLDIVLTDKGRRIAKGIVFQRELLEHCKRCLRVGFFKPPTEEADVQNQLEFMLKVLDIPYHREKTSIPNVTRKTIPDFTFKDSKSALEVKFIDKEQKELVIIEGINADITAYTKKYPVVSFLIYDLGVIREVERFENGVTVLW